jgi:hypothetical protein
MLLLRKDEVSKSVDNRRLTNLLKLGPNLNKETIENIDEVWDRVVLKKTKANIETENPYMNTIEPESNSIFR